MNMPSNQTIDLTQPTPTNNGNTLTGRIEDLASEQNLRGIQERVKNAEKTLNKLKKKINKAAINE